jgi:hypothetical protein
MNWHGFHLHSRSHERTVDVAVAQQRLTGMGVAIKPDQWQQIMAIGMGIPGIVTAFLPPHIQEKNIIPAAPEAPTTPLAQSLADKVSTGQTDTTGAKP